MDKSEDLPDEVSPENTPKISVEKSPENPGENPWKTLSTQPVYNNAWIKVEEHQVMTPAGSSGIYGKVIFKNQAVGVIPVDEFGNTWLVGQYRYTLNDWSWEIPMGGSPLKEDRAKTAVRELEEETGLIAGEINELLHLHPSNSITDEQGYVYLATKLSQGKQQLEDSESDIQVKKLPLDEAIEMAKNGKISDAMSVAGLFYLALNREKYKIKS